MSVNPSPTTLRQESRSLDSARSRYAPRANRRGDTNAGGPVTPTGARIDDDTTWPRLVMVTGFTAISGMFGRYNAQLFGMAPSVSGTGALTLAQLGTAYGDIEVWHAPDIGTSAHALKTTNLVMCFKGPRGTVRNKDIYITAASVGGGATLPIPTAEFQVIIALPGGGGLTWQAGFPRVY